MLRKIPRAPQKITAQDIRNHLRSEGFEVTERTVQRDLNQLSSVFPLVVDSREKPFGWSWQKDARSIDLPGLTVQESLTLVMAEQHLSGLMPASALEHLKPQFQAAHFRLDREPSPQRCRAWLDKVRTVPPTQPLLAPNIDSTVQRVVSEALLNERQVLIRYKPRGRDVVDEYPIHPLAIIQRGPVIYLHARIRDYPNTRVLAMHRIQYATAIDQHVEYPDGYHVDATIDAGVWGFGNGERASVRLLFKAEYVEHLVETPLSPDQRTEEHADGRVEVIASVALTPQLTWWLLGFGDGVEIVEPASLRGQFRDIAARMGNHYGPGPSS